MHDYPLNLNHNNFAQLDSVCICNHQSASKSEVQPHALAGDLVSLLQAHVHLTVGSSIFALAPKKNGRNIYLRTT